MKSHKDEIIFAVVKPSYIKTSKLDKIKVKLFNLILPRQIFVGTRQDYNKFASKYAEEINNG